MCLRGYTNQTHFSSRKDTMFKSAGAKAFKTVPYLETSQLMQTHQGRVTFSQDKPNVIVGPNGAGKSALLSALSMHCLAYLSGNSSYDNNYARGHGDDAYWGPVGSSFSREIPVFLPGLDVNTDNGPALYYRPQHIPGNNESVPKAMMLGYFDRAREYGRQVQEKSSGQARQALLARIYGVLEHNEPVDFEVLNWNGPTKVARLKPDDFYPGSPRPRQHALCVRAAAAKPGAIPTILMDEPEQSLDALAELKLWRRIESADMSRVQVIIASHSLYPLLHPEGFNLIEAVPGYIEQVRQLA